MTFVEEVETWVWRGGQCPATSVGVGSSAKGSRPKPSEAAWWYQSDCVGDSVGSGYGLTVCLPSCPMSPRVGIGARSKLADPMWWIICPIS